MRARTRSRRGALKLLEDTDDHLLAQAYFDPDLLDELSIDPRAYDFDHPANKRPNYHSANGTRIISTTKVAFGDSWCSRSRSTP